MKVYVLIQYLEQSEYTEGRYWASAQPYTEILGVYSTKEAAEKECKRLEKERDELFFEEGEDGDGTAVYYDKDGDEIEDDYYNYFVHEWEVQ